ncbi:DUF4142 domain-containing protein [Sphingomonas colocasiae]|uniref:DUF4142 domain-containing protein n=1 Tax=Sphingomonas colocasiae TaxID=1848973 RepID=A0ABS7PUZ3_9SPHN|nr:DUF4142 domain-containing protein [Sphingomonas colocasiae]MBY8825018.1 DUF4142 domain-containing protein [Sphingomonas colocasiae]
MNRIHPLMATLLAGTVLAACGDAGERRAENAADALENKVEAYEDRIENAADNAAIAVIPTPAPQDFVNRAARGDAFEIAAARLAAKNAASAEVKAFAQAMIKAHTESTAKLKAAAAKASPAIVADATLSRDQNEDLAELGRKTGAAFDEDYMDGQVDAHEDALKLMRNFAADGADAGLKTAAGEIAPVVEGHLKMARDLEAKVDR